MIHSKSKVLLKFCFLLLTVFVSRIEMAEVLNTAVSAANNDFTKDVYLNLAASQKENSIISPFSLHLVLGLASFGTKNATAQAMMKGLRIKHSETLLKDYKGIIEQLNKAKELNIANKIFASNLIEINPAYQQQAQENFLSELATVNFSEAATTAKLINDWVENKTNHKIKDLIEESSLSALTRLVLVNAIHFKGKWAHQFQPKMTTNRPFYTDETNSVEVPMMFLKESFYMYEEAGDDGFKMLELPYEKNNDQQFSMHIFLPNKRSGLPSLEQKLFQHNDSFAEKFGNIVKSTFKTEVQVTLPKFKIESQWDLVPLCKKLGMEVIFSNDADFSLMTKSEEGLKVSQIIQKAFIEVNEEGTEAAAATASNVSVKRAEVPSETSPMIFIADHPFILMLLDDKHNVILYFSKVTAIH